MPVDTLVTIANVALDLFTITSMLAVGMSLTVKQIVGPLRNLRLVLVMLVAAFAFGADTFVATLVAGLVLTIVMHLITAEWGGRRKLSLRRKRWSRTDCGKQ